MTTPPSKHNFMNEMLANVKFALVIGESGMFFLKGLNLETITVEDVDSSDPTEVISTYKGLKRAPSKRPVLKRMTLAESAVSHEFPWGPAVSWTMIKVALENEPTRFVRGWMMDPDLDSQGQAARLFINFTRDVWLTIGEQFVSHSLVPNPTSLKEAMKAWSVESVNTLLRGKVMFMASSYGLKGALPPFNKREVSFSKRRPMFFPVNKTAMDERSAWGSLREVEGAYLHNYHCFIATSSSGAVANCHEILDTIFSHLQCLPSWAPKSPGKYAGAIWASTFHKVIMVTNPEFYKMQHIRREATDTHLPTRPQASAKLVEARLELEHNGRIIGHRRRRNNKPATKRAGKRRERKEISKGHNVETSDEEGFEEGFETSSADDESC
jgi:hypothetical protein